MADKEKLKAIVKLANAMYYAAQNLTTDASRLHKAMEEYRQFVITEHKEEPVSDDLEEAARKIATRHSHITGDTYYANDAWFFKKGAQWQTEQFEKNRLAHCDVLTKEQAQMESDFVTKHLKENNRTPTFIDAIEYGMKLQKEQMMKDGIDGKIEGVLQSIEREINEDN